MNNIFLLSLGFVSWKLLQLFTTQEVDPTSSFVSGTNHIIYGVGFTIIIFYFCILNLKYSFSRAGIRALRYQILFGICAITSVLWSASTIITLGQSIYYIYYIIVGVCTANIILKSSLNISQALNRYYYLFFYIIIIDYGFDFIQNITYKRKILPAVDEMTVLSFSLFACLAVMHTKKYFAKLILLMIGMFGQSFSGLLASLIIFFRYLQNKKSILLKQVIIIFFGFVVILLFNYITLQGGKLYGKGLNFFLSGSGRFVVYQALWENFLAAPISLKALGNGFMSERAYLAQLNLPWVIDAHSNILQTLHGLGVVGIAILLYLWHRINATFRLSFKFGLITRKHLNILLASNYGFILMGLTASTYYSRPSMTALFMTGLVYILGHHIRFSKAK